MTCFMANDIPVQKYALLVRVRLVEMPSHERWISIKISRCNRPGILMCYPWKTYPSCMPQLLTTLCYFSASHPFWIYFLGRTSYVWSFGMPSHKISSLFNVTCTVSTAFMFSNWISAYSIECLTIAFPFPVSNPDQPRILWSSERCHMECFAHLCYSSAFSESASTHSLVRQWPWHFNKSQHNSISFWVS